MRNRIYLCLAYMCGNVLQRTFSSDHLLVSSTGICGFGKGNLIHRGYNQGSDCPLIKITLTYAF